MRLNPNDATQERPAAAPSAEDEVRFDEINGIGLITLNRPRQLNALSYPMIGLLDAQLAAWAVRDDIAAVVLRGAGPKAFCAGGDIRALYDSFHAGTALHRQFFVDEYQLDYRLHCYPKPVVALMDGIVMGGGMGLAQAAHLRVVTERSRVAMPETGIGLVPDVGASHFLSKLPLPLALYVGLTGVTLGAADTLLCKLADIAVPAASLEHFEQTLAAINRTGDVLADLRAALHATPAAGVPAAPLQSVLPAVLRHFRADGSVAGLLESLAAESDPAYADWAARTLEILRGRSPLMMAVTQELLLRGRDLDLADCFRMELGVVSHAFTQGDFIEGVRALIVDKDNAPRWRVRAASEVSEAVVQSFFDSPWPREAHPLAMLGRSGHA
ncbi:enoyl-CoA hydratase/isomerase family protein [Cupriavidus basilensis]|uniref:Enoyl-CoA hydratase/isomerase family protein n=1 Tax=Cupriavidus basilensis TaxID=68895 RepID=A0A643FWW8_9BURK|nr:enoyl-CoA hydratase/isomerase family protein [Cupriavidus basilensis]QOT78845.1 enoyl-CoA hydratase/isomerase family protein [Cupriavidus basilensis]